LAEYTDLPYLPDWGAGVSVRYTFATAMHLSQTTLEQRAALRSQPHREVSYVLSGKKVDQQPLVNRLISLLKTKMVVPLFFEEVLCTSWTLSGHQGGTDELTCVDVANRYNLTVVNEVDAARQKIVVFDRTGTYAPCICKVASISGNLITVSTELQYNYVASNMLIYPTMVGVLKSFEKTLDTDSVSSIAVAFSEVESWYDKDIG
jgi:hypothetical protein